MPLTEMGFNYDLFGPCFRLRLSVVQLPMVTSVSVDKSCTKRRKSIFLDLRLNLDSVNNPQEKEIKRKETGLCEMRHE